MTAVVTAICFLGYLLGYRLYSGRLAREVFDLDAASITPAHSMRDEVDYVPTNRFVLFEPAPRRRGE